MKSTLQQLSVCASDADCGPALTFALAYCVVVLGGLAFAVSDLLKRRK